MACGASLMMRVYGRSANRRFCSLRPIQCVLQHYAYLPNKSPICSVSADAIASNENNIRFPFPLEFDSPFGGYEVLTNGLKYPTGDRRGQRSESDIPPRTSLSELT